MGEQWCSLLTLVIKQITKLNKPKVPEMRYLVKEAKITEASRGEQILMNLPSDGPCMLYN